MDGRLSQLAVCPTNERAKNLNGSSSPDLPFPTYPLRVLFSYPLTFILFFFLLIFFQLPLPPGRRRATPRSTNTPNRFPPYHLPVPALSNTPTALESHRIHIDTHSHSSYAPPASTEQFGRKHRTSLIKGIHISLDGRRVHGRRRTGDSR